MAAGETDHERVARGEGPEEGGGRLRPGDGTERAAGARLAQEGGGSRRLGLIAGGRLRRRPRRSYREMLETVIAVVAVRQGGGRSRPRTGQPYAVGGR